MALTKPEDLFEDHREIVNRLERMFPGAPVTVAAVGSLTERLLHLQRWGRAYRATTPFESRITVVDSAGDDIIYRTHWSLARQHDKLAILEPATPFPLETKIKIMVEACDLGWFDTVPEPSGHLGVIVLPLP